MWFKALIVPLMLAASPVAAQDSNTFGFGGDSYAAGRNVTVTDTGLGDVFAAGNRVTVGADISGSAHLMGRIVTVDGRVGGNVYAAGMDIALDAPVAGNASLSGNSVTVSEPITGNLRAMAGDVIISAPIAGSAMIGGEAIEINSQILGDLAISGEDITWGENAKVSGTVSVYADDINTIEIPERVAPADRVEFHAMDNWEQAGTDATPEESGFWARIGGLLGGVILTTLVATLIAALAPTFTASLRERALAKPLRTLWFGALGLATAAGATVVLAMTGIGIILIPFAVIGAVALGFAGYVLGAYLLGVWAVETAGQGLPDSTADRAIAAFIGAGLLAFVALIPFVGWLAVFAVLLIGIGGLVIRVASPRFGAAV